MRKATRNITGTLVALLVANTASGSVNLDYSAVGIPNPPIVNAPTGVNGDFSAERCCGDPLLFNATEEYYTWVYELADDPDFLMADLTNIESASIDLTWRTGGDTPADDNLQIDNSNITSPFGFVTNFQTYNRTFDLIALIGLEALQTALSDGRIVFRTSNDMLPYIADLSIVTAPIPDTDGDTVTDDIDNCTLIANPAQRDTDDDGIGNFCDPDIAPAPNDCVIDFLDLSAIAAAFFSVPSAPTWNPDADFNGDDSVNFIDLNLMQARFFGSPGPSAGATCE